MSRPILIYVVLSVFVARPLVADCPEPDVYPDCRIDWLDLKIMADRWLDPPGSLADVRDNDGVNLADFAEVAAHWGQAGQSAGSLYVEISPAAAVALGAQWRLTGGPWRDTGRTLADLEPGTYTVEFKDIATWIAPPAQQVRVVGGVTTGLRGRYRHPLVINELMASNNRTKSDPQGQFDDWIEIHNTAPYPVDLAGMYLTDNPANSTKWRFPSGNPGLTTIPAGGYLLVWADNDVQDYPNGLHAAFELSAAGNDELALFDSDGTILIDTIDYPDQDVDISYGRYPDGNDTWRFFGSPTPGAGNNAGYLGQVADTKFSHTRGFYDAPFSVTIATDTPGAQIYYTLDGSSPFNPSTQTPSGIPYAGPVPVSTTTCLRAVAVKAGWKPTNVDAQTYIFLNDVIRQPANPPGFPTGQDYAMDQTVVNTYISTIKDDLKSIPTMSVSMDLDDLFGASGIYTNWRKRGVAWERPVSVEYFDPAGKEQFQINCGIRIYGGVGRREKKKTLRLLFKSIYGDSKLRCSMFGPDSADEFDTIILRANFNDGYPWGGADSQFIRDEWMRRAQLATGHPSATGTFVHLYINGLYWGLYNPTQRPDTAFSATYYGGDKENWDGVNSGQSVNSSPMTAWNTLMSMCDSDLASTAGYQRLQGNNPDGTDNPAYQDYLDLDQYINFLLVNFYGGNNDWKSHNWYAGRLRGPESTGWKGYTWDAEWVMGMRSGVNDNAVGDTTTSNYLLKPYTYLRQNPDFRLLFADHAYRAFFNGGPLYVDPAHSDWDPEHPDRNRPAAAYAELADMIDRAVICETARWGDVGGTAYTYQQWKSVRDWVLHTYMPQRSRTVLAQLRSAGLYPDIEPPVFHVNGTPMRGGHISPADLLSFTAAAGVVYYTLDGTDPKAQGSSDATNLLLVPEDAPKRVLVPTADIGTDWRGRAAFDDSAWTYVSGPPGGVGYERGVGGYEPYISIDLGDQMYNIQNTCYLRIPFNFAGEPAQLQSLTLHARYDAGFVAYINGDEVARRNFSGTPTWNSGATEKHSDSAAKQFEDIDISPLIASLRQGNNILAVHAMNHPDNQPDFLISVELTAFKGGLGDVSASAIRYTGPLTLPASSHVKARLKSAGDWSALNEATFAVGPVAENLRITELMYNPRQTGNPSDPNAEFIELKNIGATSINLNMVRFTRGIDFVFPDLELGPGDYVLVVKDRAAFDAAYQGFSGLIAGEYSGSLDNNGERITLEDAAGQVIAEFTYKDGWRGLTDGLGFSLTISDPNDKIIHDPRPGLVARWKLDDGAGTVATDAVGGNNGIVSGAAWTSGYTGGALRFDGVDDSVTIGPIPALGTNKVTIEAWVLLEDSTDGWNPVLTQHGIGRNGYYLYVEDGRPVFSLVAGRGTIRLTCPDSIAAGQWYHLAGANDGATMRLLVNGILKASADSTGRTGVEAGGYIGYDDYGPKYLHGLIDDVRIYARALSNAEYQVLASPATRWNDKDSWRASAYPGGSPGYHDAGVIPEPGSVVISEVLAHSHGWASDWIELHNTTDTPIDISGWYLSDSPADLTRYRIADGTIIDPHGYLVLREDVNFGPLSSDPGKITPFAFSENGDTAYLNSAQAGVLTGYRAAESFGPSQTGVSFGRYFKRSTGNYNFVPLATQTYARPNSYPKVGPVVISEIMYHPDWPTGGSCTNDAYEYLVLTNISPEPVTLYREEKALPWRFTEGIDYTFPEPPHQLTIQPGDYVIVARNIEAFTWRYPGVPPDKVLGPYDGQLSNDGERLELSMPGDVDKFGRRYYIMVDRVAYSDGSHPDNVPGGADIWPTEADGQGRSLVRKDLAAYGNDPNNWHAQQPLTSW